MKTKTKNEPCREWLPLILASEDGELEEGRRGALEAHLAACPACAAERRALAHSLALLGQREPATPPEAYWDALGRGVRRGLDGGRGVRHPAQRWAWAPAALLLVILAWWGIETGGRGVSQPTLLSQLERDGRRDLARLGSESAAWSEADDPAIAEELPPEELIDLLSDSELEAFSERLQELRG